MSTDELRRFMDLVRRDHGRFRKKWLVFHGTASPVFHGVAEIGAIAPWNVLQRRNIVTPTGEQFFALEPGSVARRAVSVTRDPILAAKYAKHSVAVSRALDEGVLSEVRSIFDDVRSAKLGNRKDWAYIQSLSRTLSSKLHSLFSKRRLREKDLYPVVVATVSKLPNTAEHYDRYGVLEPGEEYIVQIPAHLSYFFVPKEKIDHARRILSRRDPSLAERVFPLDVLEELHSKELKSAGHRRLLK